MMNVSSISSVSRSPGRVPTDTPGKGSSVAYAARDPELETLVREIISRVADKWTMLVIETLHEHGCLRFTRLGELVGDISQKVLTKTVRQMEADGLVSRTVYPVVPPKVEYQLTPLGLSLGAAFCGVWIWAEEHQSAINQSRAAFLARHSAL